VNGCFFNTYKHSNRGPEAPFFAVANSLENNLPELAQSVTVRCYTETMTKVKGDIKVANTFVVRDVLLAELDAGVRTTCGLLTKIESSLADNWDYRLHPNMRTLLELVNHLVQIPHTDLAILQEKSE